MVIKANGMNVRGKLWLACDYVRDDGVRCGALFQPRTPVIDVTGNPEQLAELLGALRLRASRQGWSSQHVAGEPWTDACPGHRRSHVQEGR
jgi:hypothetical protein